MTRRQCRAFRNNAHWLIHAFHHSDALRRTAKRRRRIKANFRTSSHWPGHSSRRKVKFIQEGTEPSESLPLITRLWREGWIKSSLQRNGWSSLESRTLWRSSADIEKQQEIEVQTTTNDRNQNNDIPPISKRWYASQVETSKFDKSRAMLTKLQIGKTKYFD